jgi:hypothetical protein
LIKKNANPVPQNRFLNKCAKQRCFFAVFVVTNALRNFVESPKIVIGEAETLVVTADIQGKMDKIGKIMDKL